MLAIPEFWECAGPCFLPTGLGGDLFQRTQRGFQPLHYVSRTLTDTESRYSQIEREALSAEFVTSRLQMHLLGAPRFQLETDHKHFLTLFNNPTAKLPPRIERLVMNSLYRTATLTWSTSQEKPTWPTTCPDTPHYQKLGKTIWRSN